MAAESPNQASLIAEMNDRLRTAGRGGFIVLTYGVRLLEDGAVERIVKAVRVFCDFNPDNNPHGEHDFGVVYVNHHVILWKIDYYDPSLTLGSEDPANEQATRRVLTIMLREEY